MAKQAKKPKIKQAIKRKDRFFLERSRRNVLPSQAIKSETMTNFFRSSIMTAAASAACCRRRRKKDDDDDDDWPDAIAFS